MGAQQIFIIISIIALLAIAVLVFFVNKSQKERKLTPLVGLAFAFIVAGIVFGEDKLIGHSLMGIGVLLAVVDMIKKMRKKK